MLDLNEKLLCESCFAEQTTLSEICDSCGFDNALADGFSGFRVPGALPIRAVLNKRYYVGKILGRGGFGVTYLAYDSHKDKKVAVKEFFPEKISSRLPGTNKIVPATGEKFKNFEAGAERFIEEAKILSRFSGNANIINVLDCFLANGTVYSVMEYAGGTDLKEYAVKKGGAISYDEAVKIMNPIVYALSSAHNAGVLHSDVSPDNIYIADDGNVKLLDFGAARELSDKSAPVILKRGFAPPEQYGGKCGPWSDIYSLGATFYYALTGKTPEAGNFVPPSRLGFPTPPAFERILKKSMEKNPKDRYQSISELKEALRKMEKNTKNYRQKSDIKKSFAVVVIVGIIVIAILILVPNSTDDADVPASTSSGVSSTVSSSASPTGSESPATLNDAAENVWDSAYVLNSVWGEIECYYSGEWQNDAPNGWGILTYRESGQSENSSWEEGDQLVGNFINGKAEGLCRFYAANGSFMEAVFADGSANGDGYFIAADQKKYSGTFKNGLPHGEGIYYDENGTVLAEGTFENGVFIGDAPEAPTPDVSAPDVSAPEVSANET